MTTPAPDPNKLLTIQKGTSKTALRIDTTLPLSALRAALAARDAMSPEDRFEMAAGRVSTRDEAVLRIADAIGTTTTVTIVTPDSTNKPITVVRNTIESVHRIPPDATLAALRHLLDAAEGITEREVFVGPGGKAAVPRQRESSTLAFDAVTDNKLAIVPLTWG